MNTNYDNFTYSELETMAEQEGNVLALTLVRKYIESELPDIDDIKAELRAYQIQPAVDAIQAFEQWWDEYHKSEDYLSNYFGRHMIADSIAYSDHLKPQILELIPDITDSEYDSVIDQILYDMFGSEIRLSYMGTRPQNGELVVCSFDLGEIEEQLPDELLKQIADLTDDEISDAFKDACFNKRSDNAVYFDHSYDVVGMYIQAASVIEYVNDLRGEGAE